MNTIPIKSDLSEIQKKKLAAYKEQGVNAAVIDHIALRWSKRNAITKDCDYQPPIRGLDQKSAE